jgi:hypothetical protein
MPAATNRFGQLALTGVAQQLSAMGGSKSGVVIKALAANAGKVYIGHDNTVSATTGYELSAGQDVPLEALNPNRMWVIGTAADRICWATIAP